MEYKKVKKLSHCEAAYLAGIIDGEGTITLTRKHRNENRQLVVSISNNERCLLDYVLKIVGAGKITSKKTYQKQHMPSFTYAIANRQALDLLKQITIYLRSYKMARSKLVLDQYINLTPRNGKYSLELLQKRSQFEQALLDIKPS